MIESRQTINTKTRIAKLISEHTQISKREIASVLHISMPTTLQSVKELLDEGIIIESGEYKSTGGRKAKALSIAETLPRIIGMDITANHVVFVSVNMRREIQNKTRIRIAFEPSFSYFERISQMFHEFVKEHQIHDIFGVGVSVPGIVDKEKKILLRSHVIGVTDFSLRVFEDLIQHSCELENDANSAAYAELSGKTGHAPNTIYLSLSNTVGGAIYLQNTLYPGEHFRSGEFGHMIIEKDGRSCYCGKRGCMDSYISAKVLLKEDSETETLEQFFEQLKGKNPKIQVIWDEYMDYLAVAVTNLRMAFDCDIILGGYVGSYLKEYLPAWSQKLAEYNQFDVDASYVYAGTYQWEAAAYGAALPFVSRFFEQL